MIEERLTHFVIGAFFEVYNVLGYGLLEHLYVRAMEQELVARGHAVEHEVRVPVWYKGAKLSTQRLDMLVDRRVVVETKATFELHRAAPHQLYNYLRATRLEVGLLLHFGPEAKFHRIVCLNAERPSRTFAGPAPPTAYQPDLAPPPDPNF